MLSKSYIYSLLLLPCILFPQISFAIQEKVVKDNGEIKAFVSTHELTRIAIENDRIQNVRGPDGAYQIKADPNQGAIFIQPTADFQKKTFTIFLATEQNHNYVLELMPRDQNADMILLKPRGLKNPLAKRWETTSPYIEAITQLMKSMIYQDTLEGYAIETIAKSKRQHFNHNIDVQIKILYQGAHLQGVIYKVSNRTAQTITLNEYQFYQSRDRAIALSQSVIGPKAQALIYKVRSHE